MNLLAALLGLTYFALLVFFVVLGLVHVATRHCGRGLAVLLGGGLLLASMWGFGRSPEQQQVADIAPQQVVPVDVALVSTEKLWEHLNRPRIVLEGDGKGPASDAVTANNIGKNTGNESGNNTGNNTGKIAAKVAEKVELSLAEKTVSAMPTQPGRPGWVDIPPKRVGNVYRVVVAAGPYQTEAECYQNLEPQLAKEVRQRIEQLVPGSRRFGFAERVGLAARVDQGDFADLGHRVDLEQMGIAMEYVWRDICTEAWVETSAASFGEMKHVHVLMEFGTAQDKALAQAYRTYLRQGRIAGVGITAGAIVVSLMLLYGLLQADTVTKGYYSKRLFFGVPAAIIGLILLFIA